MRSGIENKLKTTKLRCSKKTKKDKVVLVMSRMNDRDSNSNSSAVIKTASTSSIITNMGERRFKESGNTF